MRHDDNGIVRADDPSANGTGGNGDGARVNGHGHELPDAIKNLPPSIRKRFESVLHREVEEARTGVSDLRAAEERDRAKRRATEKVQEWPPLRLHARDDEETPPFPVDVFPAPLATYCHELCEAKCVPAELVGPAMMAALSAVIGQSVNVRYKKDWTEPALLWTILIADPGSAKTPTLDSVLAPIRDINAVLRHHSKKELRAWKKARRDYHRDPTGEKDDPQNPVPKDDPGDDPPPRAALIVDDVTKEVLGPMLEDNPRGLLLDCDEAMSWIGGMNQYRGGRGNDRQNWMKVWSCVPWTIDRKGGGESRFVARPFVAVLAGIVPDCIEDLTMAVRKRDGFIDRILFAFPDPGTIGSEEISDAEISEWAEDEWRKILTRLFEAKMRTEGIHERAYILRFDAQAKAAFREWYRGHNRERRSPDLPRVLKGAYAKMNAYCLRLTLIIARLRQCQQTPDGEPVQDAIRAGDVEAATRLVAFYKGQFRKVALAITGATPSTDVGDLLGLIARKGWERFTPRDVDAATKRFRDDPESLDQALSKLERMGAIRAVGTAPAVGRKLAKSHYEVRPELVKREQTDENAPHAPHLDATPSGKATNGNDERATPAPQRATSATLRTLHARAPSIQSVARVAQCGAPAPHLSDQAPQGLAPECGAVALYPSVFFVYGVPRSFAPDFAAPLADGRKRPVRVVCMPIDPTAQPAVGGVPGPR